MRGFFEEAFNPTWPLAEVLDWRRDFDPDLSMQEAFEELRQIALSGQVHAWGFRCNEQWSKQPLRPLPWKPFGALGVEPPRDESIPAGVWEDLYPVVDHEGRPTGALNFISVRLLAWMKVWLGQTDLIRAWVPIIEARQSSRLVPSEKTAMPDGAGVVYRTGLPGKPTSWSFIETECRQRYAANERYESVAEWARVLLDWLKSHHPSAAQPKEKTLTNKLSPLLRELNTSARQNF
jgi:hypothetical protein